MKNSNIKQINERLLAYQCIYEIFYRDAYANLSLQKIFKSHKLLSRDKALITELVYGICRKCNYLQYIVEKLSNRSINKIHKSVRILLYLGLYQLIYLDIIPESAAVNETVKLTKKITHQGNVRFVNAILRNFLRKKAEINDFSKLSKFEKLSLIYNQPIWLIQKWNKDYGINKTKEILQAFNLPENLFVRCNELKITTNDLIKIFDENKIEYSGVENFPNIFLIKNGVNLFKTDLLEKGYIFIQSISSIIPAYALDPKPYEKVLDMCAAPGSKTTQIAQLMDNKGSIDAWDLYPHKIKLIEENINRLGVKIVTPKLQDATKLLPTLTGQYDKVLLDAPCSGLGVLGHKPELRWRRTEETIESLISTQKDLLKCASTYVKKGGTLVYSTCTLNINENEKIVDWFLNQKKEFYLDSIAVNDIINSENGMLTLWPDTLKSDGFFIAKFKRR